MLVATFSEAAKNQINGQLLPHPQDPTYRFPISCIEDCVGNWITTQYEAEHYNLEYPETPIEFTLIEHCPQEDEEGR